MTKVLLGLAMMLSPVVYGQANNVDEVAVRDVIGKMEAAWTKHDMREWTSYMTDDVEWVNIVGMWWRGKDEVFRAHDAFHRTIFQGRSFEKPDTVEVRRISPDTFVVNTVQRTGAFTTPSGHVMPAARNILTTVFVRRDGRWLLTAGQNTVIDEDAQKNNPVKK